MTSASTGSGAPTKSAAWSPNDGDEIGWLKRPVGEHAVDDLESEREPFDGVERRGRIGGDRRPSGAFSLNTISGSIFGEHSRPRDSDATFARAYSHRVVVHVRPHQRVELEHAPHRLVGEADLASDGRAAGRARRCGASSASTRVGGGQIELRDRARTAASRSVRRPRVGGNQFGRRAPWDRGQPTYFDRLHGHGGAGREPSTRASPIARPAATSAITALP